MNASILRSVLLLSTLGAAACAAPVPTLGDFEDGSSTKARATGDDADKEEAAPKAAANVPEGSQPATPARPAPSSPAAAPMLRASFRGADGIKVGDFQLGRICTDAGAENSRATFVDGKALVLVSVADGKTVYGRLEGPELEAMKKEMTVAEGGRFAMAVDPQKLPTSPTEMAMVMEGDSRFGSPAKCNYDVRPSNDEERRAKLMPEDCGIIGYVQAHWDASKKEVVAKATGQFLLAADNEGRAGFPKGDYYTGCDGHSSPLVLDLGGRGVRLTKPTGDLFDIDGDGKRDEISWVVSDDTPFLVRDGNGNGVVDGVDEMFGNATRPAPLSTAARASRDGFEALALWDRAELGGSGDGVVDASDGVWSTLRLWFDRNHDGRTDPGELETLEAHGVRALSLGYVQVREPLFSGGASGARLGAVKQRGAVTLRSGAVVPMLDVWFEKDM